MAAKSPRAKVVGHFDALLNVKKAANFSLKATGSPTIFVKVFWKKLTLSP